MARRFRVDDLNAIDKQFQDLLDEKDYTIVLVEGSVVMRKTLCNALRQAGADKLVEAGNGIDALSLLRSAQGARVVVSELNLPAFDGLQILQEIRSAEDLSDVPILFMSSEVRKERIVAAIKGGAKAYLKKPFKPEALVDKLRELGYL